MALRGAGELFRRHGKYVFIVLLCLQLQKKKWSPLAACNIEEVP